MWSVSTNDEIRDWFDHFVVGFIEHDVQKCCLAGANYGVALMLLCYTELLGGLKTGDLGRDNTVQVNFNAGLELLDEGLMRYEPGAAPFYASFTAKVDGKPANLYKIMRCGMVHEYFSKGGTWVANSPDKHNISPGMRGFAWYPVDSTPRLHFNVNAYFEHFKQAVEFLRARIIVDPAWRANFQKAIGNVNRTITQ